MSKPSLTLCPQQAALYEWYAGKRALLAVAGILRSLAVEDFDPDEVPGPPMIWVTLASPTQHRAVQITVSADGRYRVIYLSSFLDINGRRLNRLSPMPVEPAEVTAMTEDFSRWVCEDAEKMRTKFREHLGTLGTEAFDTSHRRAVLTELAVAMGGSVRHAYVHHCLVHGCADPSDPSTMDPVKCEEAVDLYYHQVDGDRLLCAETMA